MDSDNKESEAEDVFTDPKPVGEGDAIHVQTIQIEEKQIIGLNPYEVWWNLYMDTSNMKLALEISQWVISDLYNTLCC